MKALYDLAAPAKLNLFLHLVGRRDDGYHLLQSVFMLIDWCDALHIESRANSQITREDLGAPLPPDDLTLRAARALQLHTGTTQGAHIAIDKQVPAQAGMGGGSSDAATCLLALNRLWNTGLDLPALERIGLALGADVPFFLRGHNAWVEGIGEQITPIPLAPGRFVVLKPTGGLETRAIFADASLQRSTPPAILSGFAAISESQSQHLGVDYGHNDLQPVAERLCPEVSEAIQWLGNQGLKARMTGSGTSVFAALPHDTELPAPPTGWQLRKCSNLAQHPLAGWAGQED